MVVTSTGLRSTGGSLSQGFRSVRSCSALLFGDRAARYVVTVWSGVDVLSDLLRVVRGAVVPMVVVWSGVDVLAKLLLVVRGAVVPMVVVWSGVDVLAKLLLVVRGAVVPAVVVWSGVDVLTNFLPVVRGAVVYPGKKDHHKRLTTERPHPTGGSCPWEGHGKGKLIRILFSVYFGGFRG